MRFACCSLGGSRRSCVQLSMDWVISLSVVVLVLMGKVSKDDLHACTIIRRECQSPRETYPGGGSAQHSHLILASLPSDPTLGRLGTHPPRDLGNDLRTPPPPPTPTLPPPPPEKSRSLFTCRMTYQLSMCSPIVITFLINLINPPSPQAEDDAEPDRTCQSCV